MIDREFNDIINSTNLPLLIDFMADWCAPCKALQPLVDEVKEQRIGSLRVITVNVDECPEAATRMAVRSLPTLVMMRDGQVQELAIGSLNKKKLNDFIDRNI